MLWPYSWNQLRGSVAGTGGPGGGVQALTFASDGTLMVMEGNMVDDTQDGVACKRDTGLYAGYSYEFRGTKCEHKVWNQSDGSVAVDNGNPSVVNHPTTLDWATVADGQTDDWHYVHLYGGNSPHSMKIGFAADCIRVTGRNPSVRRPQGLFDLRGTNYRADSTALRFTGGQVIFGYDNWTLLPYGGFDNTDCALGARLRFRVVPDGTNTPLQVYVGGWLSDNSWYRVAVDGFEDGTYGSMADAVRYTAFRTEPTWQKILTIPTPGNTPRVVDAWLWENARDRLFKLHQIVVTNGTLDPTPPSALPILGVFGDSISETDYNGLVNGHGWVHQLSMSDGYAPANFSLFGYWISQLVDPAFPGSPGRLANLFATNPDKIVIHMGVNDRNNGRTSAQYQADVTTLFNQCIANTSASIFMPLFYQARSTSGAPCNSARATWYSALQAAQAACDNPARVTVWDTTGVLNDDAGDWYAGDDLHPSIQGQTKIAADMRAHL